MNFVKQVPLIGCVAAVYAILAFVSADLPARQLAAVNLPSGAVWAISLGDLLLLLSVIGLYFEVLKATRTSQASVLDHILSLFSFVGCLVGFLLAASLGTSTFLVIMVMALFDVIAGFTITISTARRDFAFGDRQ